MLYLPQDADFHRWERFQSQYQYEQKAPQREEKDYPWDYLGEWNVRIISSVMGSTTSTYISVPFFG